MHLKPLDPKFRELWYEFISQLQTPEWIRAMAEHYYKTGTCRPADLRRVLGDQTKGVYIGPGDNIEAFLACYQSPLLDSCRHPKKESADGSGTDGSTISPMHNFHNNVMRLVEEAEQARRTGHLQAAQEKLRQAFEQEQQAAALSATELSLEPTRSVLHRSAASLALERGALREAERLITVALSGNPPEEIAEELRDLLEQVYFGGKKGRKPLTRNSAVP